MACLGYTWRSSCDAIAAVHKRARDGRAYMASSVTTVNVIVHTIGQARAAHRPNLWCLLEGGQRYIARMQSHFTGLTLHLWIPQRKFSMRLMLLLQSAIAVLAQLPAFNLPPPLGPHNVGVKHVYLPAPKSQVPPRDIITSIWYPTTPNINSTQYPLAPLYDPGYASYLERTSGLPAGFTSSILSGAHLNAPLFNTKPKHARPGCDTHPDVIFFSPGYGGSRQDGTANLINLASYGYIVVGIDHPNDTGFIAYPDGRQLEYVVVPFEWDDVDGPTRFSDQRVKDIEFVRQALEKISAPIPGLKGRLDLGKVGVFGHSLGGSAAASTLLANPKNFVAGANLDGSLWGAPRNSTGLKNTPFLIMAAENHTSCDSFPDWYNFWKRSKGGLEIEIQVKGAQHGTYADFGAFYHVLRDAGVVPDLDPEGLAFGTIGTRILEVEVAYCRCFVLV